MEALLDKIQVAIETGKLEVATENVNKALEEGANPQVIISDALIKRNGSHRATFSGWKSICSQFIDVCPGHERLAGNTQTFIK